METTRLSDKGQIVIPKRVRDAHGWKSGVKFIVEDTEDGIRLKPFNPYQRTAIKEILGCLGYKGPRKSVKEMHDAIAEGARESL
jgi:AbrB family looped-hinge helix DNA binding protein